MAYVMLIPGTTLWEEVHSMSQALAQRESAVSSSNRERALKILSKSIYRELRQNGYEPKQIVALATELISLVTTDIKEDSRVA
jgi:hypothetical protein